MADTPKLPIKLDSATNGEYAPLPLAAPLNTRGGSRPSASPRTRVVSE